MIPRSSTVQSAILYLLAGANFASAQEIRKDVVTPIVPMDEYDPR